MRKFALATLALSSLIGSHVQASPIIQNYAFDLNFTDVMFVPCTGSPDCVNGDPILPGVRYTGHFGVDSGDLLSDGYVDAPFAYFNLTLGNYTWDLDQPFPLSDLAGTVFFNPDTGIRGRSPNLETFLVSGGSVQTLCCGVYGESDAPFVDLIGFDLFGVTSPYAGAVSGGGSREYFAAAGAFTVYRVPEPGTLTLMLVGLSGLGAWLSSRR
ncbi:MAG TPA: PEP-CTERM sorting domain-containing protein [Steroidobacteraceae bacterium]|nr:PEP-CTERM sorting domain-containing protein [Steroidobacteraceae bacterium]